MTKVHIAKRERPTRIFKFYVLQLIARACLFVVGISLYVRDPNLLDVRTQFGLAQGLSFANVVFVLLLLDLVSKLRPHAKIAMGSLKQYEEFHVPTSRLFSGGLSEFRNHARKLLEQTPELIDKSRTRTKRAIHETATGVAEAGKQLAINADVLRVLPWSEEDRTASDKLRADIRRQRMHEVVPVIVFWVLFNVAIGLFLDRFGVFSPSTALLWTLFYFLFDMICVVFWCPLQLALMRNRCCTTCQIFNWDGIMTVTPLIPVLCLFSWVLVAMALFVLVRWELAFFRHPERFDERTNASLRCVNCKDKLCYLRKPFTPRKA